MDRSKNITLAIVATIFMFATVACGADNNAASTLQEELNDSVVPAQTGDADDFMCTFYETMPEYIGGVEALMKFIDDNLKLPECVKSGEVSGTCVIGFVVLPSGDCDEFEVVRSLNEECDAEAIRLLKKMPKWKPGMKKNVPTREKYCVPVKFAKEK
ncbi:MAG: energy transducer TonB [Bacteroidaceae bacterium]|nr:energy transducer TonB [Bacteroidaceae bacterium]